MRDGDYIRRRALATISAMALMTAAYFYPELLAASDPDLLGGVGILHRLPSRIVVVALAILAVAVGVILWPKSDNSSHISTKRTPGSTRHGERRPTTNGARATPSSREDPQGQCYPRIMEQEEHGAKSR